MMRAAMDKTRKATKRKAERKAAKAITDQLSVRGERLSAFGRRCYGLGSDDANISTSDSADSRNDHMGT